MSIKMIIMDIYELDDSGAADKVERIEGYYNGKSFELDRIFSDYDEKEETYGLIEVEWYEGDVSATGQYQDGGILDGRNKDGFFEGEWKNKGMEGLIQLTIADDKLTGNWKKDSNLTDDFIETYIETYNDRLPNLRKHIAKKAKQNFGELGTVWSMKNGYSGYLVKDPEDWAQLKGPVGLAIRLCGCESFDQVLETEAQKEFGQHFSNIFFFTLKEIEELPAQYREHLKAMLFTTIDPVYHVEEWNLDKADGILTQAIGALLRYEFGLDFNAYITENQVSVSYDGQELALFGVAGVSDIEYPVDYSQMEADLLALIL